jgi:phosphoenolpyruvate phosphomutase
MVRVMGAHNGISAKLVERHGFDAIWASSFEISASWGVPDASILTMTEFLETARAMNDVVGLPIVADCDSGFGDPTIVSHMMRKYEGAGIAAVCIEDKLFPKRNSFAGSEHQKLETIPEFVEKIRAACDARRKETIFIARTEALIAGGGIDEALERGYAYADAGADVVLVHSKSRTPAQVFDFARRWQGRTPLIAIPTTYNQTTLDEFESAGIRIVIYANQAMRAAVQAMNDVMARIHLAGSTMAVEKEIASIEDLFELQGMKDVRQVAR